MPSTAPRRARSLAAACATGLITALAVAGTTGTAHADPPPLLVDYDANGTSFIAKPATTVTLGPATLSTAVSATDGTFTGHLALPDTRAKFNALGLLPTTATVGFREAAPVTGRLITTGSTQTVTSTATYYLTLRNIKVAGLPVFEGPKCQTAAPVSIPANTPAGQLFNLISGGTLTGTYTIGKFKDCGFTTALLNVLVPGGGNTVTLTVSNGRLGG